MPTTMRVHHGKFRTHTAKNFFTALRIHGYQVAHELVARFPFCILAKANTDRQKRRDDPNGDICRRHEKNKEAKRISDNLTRPVPPVATGSFIVVKS